MSSARLCPVSHQGVFSRHNTIWLLKSIWRARIWRRWMGDCGRRAFVLGEWIIYRHGFTFICFFCGADLARKTHELGGRGSHRFRTCAEDQWAGVCVISLHLVSHCSCRLDHTRLCCMGHRAAALAWEVAHAYCSAHLLWECHDVFLNATRAELCILMTVFKVWQSTVSARPAHQVSLFCRKD